jgi:hypothetical protein
MNAFLFIPLLAATWVLGFVLSLFAAHYFLTVLESTAAGNDNVVWPEEPLIDWFWKAFYLAFLGGVWLAPMIVVGRLLIADPWIQMVFIALAFWLLFPIGMISSQSAESIWVPFWPGVLKRLSQRMPAVIGFYLFSIPIAFAFVGSFHVITRSEASFVLGLFLAPIGAGAFLAYARTLGRLGFVLSFTQGAANERIKEDRRKKKQRPRTGVHDEQPINAQPSELPPVETPFEGAITGYNVVFDDRPPADELPKPTRPSYLDEDDGEPLQLEPESVEESNRARERERMNKPPLPEPDPDEMAAWEQRRAMKEPKQPYDARLLTFLFEPRSTTAWIVLASGLALLGAMIRALRELKPG